MLGVNAGTTQRQFTLFAVQADRSSRMAWTFGIIEYSNLLSLQNKGKILPDITAQNRKKLTDLLFYVWNPDKHTDKTIKNKNIFTVCMKYDGKIIVKYLIMLGLLCDSKPWLHIFLNLGTRLLFVCCGARTQLYSLTIFAP